LLKSASMEGRRIGTWFETRAIRVAAMLKPAMIP
jgi:hypothetical protein